MKNLLALILFLVPFSLFAGDWDGAEAVSYTHLRAHET